MTRNSQDDLSIAQNLLIHYIDFLLIRTEQQTYTIKHEFSTLLSLSLPEECKSYIKRHEKNHLDSTNRYAEFLLEIKRIILNFFTSNQKNLPLYSKEAYQ